MVLARSHRSRARHPDQAALRHGGSSTPTACARRLAPDPRRWDHRRSSRRSRGADRREAPALQRTPHPDRAVGQSERPVPTVPDVVEGGPVRGRTHLVDRQRGTTRARRRAETAPRPGPPRGPRPDRHPRRLRHQPVRRVHRPRRRHGREVVHDARRPGRRRRASRRSRAWRPATTLHPLQTAFWEKHGLQCGFCTPGHDHGRGRPARPQPGPDRRRDPPRDRGQHLPLHRLPEHRRRDPRRRRDDARPGRGPVAA